MKSHLEEEGFFEHCSVIYFKRFGRPRGCGKCKISSEFNSSLCCSRCNNCKWNPLEFKIQHESQIGDLEMKNLYAWGIINFFWNWCQSHLFLLDISLLLCAHCFRQTGFSSFREIHFLSSTPIPILFEATISPDFSK